MTAVCLLFSTAQRDSPNTDFFFQVREKSFSHRTLLFQKLEGCVTMTGPQSHMFYPHKAHVPCCRVKFQKSMIPIPCKSKSWQTLSINLDVAWNCMLYAAGGHWTYWTLKYMSPLYSPILQILYNCISITLIIFKLIFYDISWCQIF